MKDLISRQFAIDAIDHIFPVDTEYDCTLLDRVDVRRVLSDLPSAQPEHLTGHWIRVGDGYTDYFKCSECGELSDYEDNFCCGCGADMREGGENATD